MGTTFKILKFIIIGITSIYIVSAIVVAFLLQFTNVLNR